MIERVRAIEEKWQREWEKKRVFEAEPGKKKKYFITFPFPYMNAALHLGHAFSAVRLDLIARYKKMRGYNVLFPFAFHATGEPIMGVAERLKMGDERQREILRKSGIKDADINKFENPRYIINYWKTHDTVDAKSFGLAVDWRRSFTTVDKDFNKFIEWQYRKLRKKGYVVKGTHPVIYCPRCKSPTGDHDRLDGVGEIVEEFTLLKFKRGDEYLIAATLRPETVFGQTNLWVHPDAVYKKIVVNNEKWIVSHECAEKLVNQKDGVKVVEEVHGSSLLYDKVKAPMINREIPVLPASFCDPKVGTGIVTSVPSDAPYDYIALKDLKAEIKPVPIIKTEGWGDSPAEKIIAQMGITSQKDVDKLEQATKIIYKAGFHKGVMNKNCKKYMGMKVEDAKEKVKKEMIRKKEADVMYECSGKVVCRCTTECIVKIIKDQWFLDYGNRVWKRKVKKLLKKMEIYPEEARNQFRAVVDWLKEKACARRSGLGTKVPWDKGWIVETLSDSTMYMAFYAIKNIINEEGVRPEQLTDELFDYVFLNKKGKLKVKRKAAERMRKSFDHWYPVDLRGSAKELLPNHLTFYLFHHTAIFPEKYWPNSITVNGMLKVEGEKMSKSKGNFITLRKGINDYGSTGARLALLDSAEGMDDPDFRSNAAKLFNTKCLRMIRNAELVKESKDSSLDMSDKWLLSRVQSHVSGATENLEALNNRQALQAGFHLLNNDIEDYLRIRKNPNKKVLKNALETFAKLLTPYAPHMAEELWAALGNKGLIINTRWPEVKKSLVNKDVERAFGYYKVVSDDVSKIVKIIGKKPSAIRIIVSPRWKYVFYRKLKKVLEKHSDMSSVMKKVMVLGHDEIPRIVQAVLKDRSKMPLHMFSQKREVEMLKDYANKLAKDFSAEVVVEIAEKSSSQKAMQASPSKPAIVLE
jgi:leucyl-tRNA synthetase